MNLADGVQFVSFVILALLMLGASLGVVLLNNIVYSAFLLALVFISIAGLYILLNAGFVAAAQVLIYVGAVNVLILFGIMLVNKRQPFSVIRNAWLGRAATALVCFGLFALLGTMVLATPWPLSNAPIAGDRAIYIIGRHFFTDFLLPFELVSVLLLMALIGAIVLARREFLPDDSSVVQPQQPILTLPERPRELTGVVPGSPERTIASSPGDRNA